jgi:hypothetical protein
MGIVNGVFVCRRSAAFDGDEYPVMVFEGSGVKGPLNTCEVRPCVEWMWNS